MDLGPSLGPGSPSGSVSLVIAGVLFGGAGLQQEVSEDRVNQTKSLSLYLSQVRSSQCVLVPLSAHALELGQDH